ncbi:Hypothetical predicted protein [Octopus vulgaris]|uniref:Uncharacterized protein n=1 Tax=Octopus vulgaris TaxID=6645 RepID=A0AA36BPH4_OCTVU|nr:Hypothetical predicted protein [Octopus vulgaris]
MANTTIILCLILLFVPTTLSLSSGGISTLMTYKSRQHAWENFFLSLEYCSSDGLFQSKLRYTRSIVISAMDKVWDIKYVHLLLMFPIYFFKYKETDTIQPAFSCFYKVFNEPFAIPSNIRRKRRSADLQLSTKFLDFFGELVEEDFLESVPVEKVQNIKDWDSRNIRTEDTISVLINDMRFLKGFHVFVNEFKSYISNCLDKTHKITTQEYKFCNAVKLSFRNLLTETIV